MRSDIKAEWERLVKASNGCTVRRCGACAEARSTTIAARQFAALWRKAERAGMERAAQLIETTFGKNIAAVVIREHVGGYDLAAVRRNAPKGKR